MSRIGHAIRELTGCCRPWSMAKLAAYGQVLSCVSQTGFSRPRSPGRHPLLLEHTADPPPDTVARRARQLTTTRRGGLNVPRAPRSSPPLPSKSCPRSFLSCLPNSSPLQQYPQQQVSRLSRQRGRGYKRATIAIAHKMPRVICAVLTSRNPYRDPETDYEAPMVKRNAARWIRRLTKHGIDPTAGEIAQQVHA